MAAEGGPNIIEDGLVLYLDAANKKSYPGTGTTWSDLAGSNNGTLTNGPTFDSGNGGSLVFDGSNDYINAPVTKTANVSFSCWASSRSSGEGQMLFNAGPNGSGPDVYFTSGLVCWNIWDGAGNPFGNIPDSVDDGKFHYYVVVNDQSTNAKLYYDGILLGTATYRTAATTTNLYVGGTNGTYIWRGSISNFKVHNRLLTASEVLQNYNATKGRYGL